MRPLRLVIEGLRSFRTPVMIDFGAYDQIAIVGDTGAGKSSILEAITYALYGKTTFSGQGNQELMNDTSTTLRVVLRFRVSGVVWETARALKRAGDGTVGGAKATLQRLGANGELAEIVEQVGTVNDRILKLIGLNREAFLRTVVLPQGRFARLLVEDGPTERSTILRQVWRTDELEEIGDLAHEARQAILEKRIRLESEAERHPGNPDAHLALLEGKSRDAIEKAATAGSLAARADESVATLKRAGHDLRRSEEVSNLLKVPSVSLDDLDGIGDKAAEMRKEEAELRRDLLTLEGDLAEMPKDDDGPQSEEVTVAITRLDGLAPVVAEAEVKAEEYRVSRRLAATEAKAAEKAQRLAELHADQTREHGSHTEGLSSALETARSRQNEVAECWDDCSAKARAFEESTEELRVLRDREDGLRATCKGALEGCNRLEKAATLAEDHLAIIQRADFASAAAEGLHPGDDCPVCERQLGSDWSAPTSADLAEAQAASEEARDAVEKARADAAELEGKRKGVQERIPAAEEEAREADRRYRRALGDLAKVVGANESGVLPEREQVLEPFRVAYETAERALAAHEQEHEELVEEGRRLESIASLAQEAASNAKENATTRVRDAQRAMKRLVDAVLGVPAPFRPIIALPEDPVDLVSANTDDIEARKVLASARRSVLDERSSERVALRDEIAVTQEKLDDLGGRRQAEVEGPTAKIVRAANRHRDKLVEAAGLLGVEDRPPAALATRDIAAISEQITDQLGLHSRLIETASNVAAGARKDESVAATVLHGMADELAIGTEDAETVAQEVHRAANEAEWLRLQAQRNLDKFRAIDGHLRELLSLLVEVKAKESALRDLEDALKPGAFLKWLTQRRSRHLLVHASRTMERMTDRYAFADPDDVEGQWRIYDRESGQARSPDSLSGGEQFIASLALALGMVEMMARSGGRLESLFLDEGFGALDRNNLDGALEALTTAVTGGRMLGVISHVRAVAEQFDNVLAVTRDAGGSRVAWLSGHQRDQMAESDLSRMLD